MEISNLKECIVRVTVRNNDRWGESYVYKKDNSRHSLEENTKS